MWIYPVVILIKFRMTNDCRLLRVLDARKEMTDNGIFNFFFSG